MKTKHILIVSIAFLGLLSCTKNEIMTYEDENFIYLEGWEERTTGEFLNTSFTFLFEDETVNEKVIEIPVLVTGKMNDNDRTFSLNVVDSLTTAIEGTHFTIDDAQQIIPANSTGSSLKIRLIKTADMDDTEYQLGIEIISNDAFTAGVSTVAVITYSNFFAEPDWWQYELFDGHPHLGPFTQIKAILWLQYRGVTDGSDPLIEYRRGYNDWIGGYNYHGAESWALINAFREWLKTGPDAPYYDENGDLILDTFNYI